MNVVKYVKNYVKRIHIMDDAIDILNDARTASREADEADKKEIMSVIQDMEELLDGMTNPTHVEGVRILKWS